MANQVTVWPPDCPAVPSGPGTRSAAARRQAVRCGRRCARPTTDRTPTPQAGAAGSTAAASGTSTNTRLRTASVAPRCVASGPVGGADSAAWCPVTDSPIQAVAADGWPGPGTAHRAGTGVAHSQGQAVARATAIGRRSPAPPRCGGRLCRRPLPPRGRSGPHPGVGPADGLPYFRTQRDAVEASLGVPGGEEAHPAMALRTIAIKQDQDRVRAHRLIHLMDDSGHTGGQAAAASCRASTLEFMSAMRSVGMGGIGDHDGSGQLGNP